MKRTYRVQGMPPPIRRVGVASCIAAVGRYGYPVHGTAALVSPARQHGWT